MAQWYAVIDSATGAAVRYGTNTQGPAALAAIGQERIAVDGPPDGRPWNPAARQFDAAPPAPLTSQELRNAAAADYAAAATDSQRLDAIAKALGLV